MDELKIMEVLIANLKDSGIVDLPGEAQSRIIKYVTSYLNIQTNCGGSTPIVHRFPSDPISLMMPVPPVE